MGKGGRGKSSSATSSASKEEDDKLLAAAIAENKIAKEQQQQQQADGAKASGRKPSAGGASSSSEPPKAALTVSEIVQKLNAVPCFCMLNSESNLVTLKDPTDATGKKELCVWFSCPNEAKTTLETCKVANPDCDGLHLGVTPLGIAYAFACGWAECHFYGEKQVRGSTEAFAGAQDPIPLLRDQAVAQGLEPQSWHVPDDAAGCTVPGLHSVGAIEPMLQKEPGGSRGTGRCCRAR